MRVLVNAVAARRGGAATYLRHFLRLASGGENEFVVLTSRDVDVPAHGLERLEFGAELENPLRRFLFDQLEVPRLCEKLRCEALLSTNNFGSLVSPVRQVLLVRNPIFFSKLFLERQARLGTTKQRAEILIRRVLILESILGADASVFPTQAMLDEVAGWARLPRDRCHVVPHGFDAEDFRRRASIHRGLFSHQMSPYDLNVCFVSHYAQHKNLATLCRGFALARRLQPPGSPSLHLWLTADLARWRQIEGLVWSEDLEAVRALAAEGGATDLGTVSHEQVAGLYAACQALVFPSLAESFGHPLKEAMSLGLPIVASDLPVNREICGDYARYFNASNPESLADALVEFAATGGEAARQVEGAKLSFTWEDHVATLSELLTA